MNSPAQPLPVPCTQQDILLAARRYAESFVEAKYHNFNALSGTVQREAAAKFAVGQFEILYQVIQAYERQLIESATIADVVAPSRLAAEAERWYEVSRRYDGMKTSRCRTVLDALNLDGDPTDPLEVVVDAAIAYRKHKTPTQL